MNYMERDHHRIEVFTFTSHCADTVSQAKPHKTSHFSLYKQHSSRPNQKLLMARAMPSAHCMTPAHMAVDLGAKGLQKPLSLKISRMLYMFLWWQWTGS